MAVPAWTWLLLKKVKAFQEYKQMDEFIGLTQLLDESQQEVAEHGKCIGNTLQTLQCVKLFDALVCLRMLMNILYGMV